MDIISESVYFNSLKKTLIAIYDLFLNGESGRSDIVPCFNVFKSTDKINWTNHWTNWTNHWTNWTNQILADFVEKKPFLTTEYGASFLLENNNITNALQIYLVIMESKREHMKCVLKIAKQWHKSLISGAPRRKKN